MTDNWNYPIVGPFAKATASPYVFAAADMGGRDPRSYQWTFMGNGTITVKGVLEDDTVSAAIGTVSGNAVIVPAGPWVAYEVTFGTATTFKAHGRRVFAQGAG